MHIAFKADMGNLPVPPTFTARSSATYGTIALLPVFNTERVSIVRPARVEGKDVAIH